MRVVSSLSSLSSQPSSPTTRKTDLWQVHWPALAFFFCVALWVLHGKDGKDKEPDLLALAHFCSNLGNVIFLTLGIGVLLFLAWRTKSRRYAQQVIGVILGETLVYGLIKEVSFQVFHFGARPSGGSGGFPSGHSACAFALAFLLTERFHKLGFLWYGCAALIAWSRLDEGAHYAYQIIAGMVLGLLCAFVGVLKYPVVFPENLSDALLARRKGSEEHRKGSEEQ